MKFAIAAGLATLLATTASATAADLKLSHQWSTQDVRHQVAQMVADEVKDAGIDITIYPSASLFKPREQYNPLSRGQLDMTVLPLSYAGGQRPEYNLTLMPGLVKNHDHAARLVASDFMAKIEEIMAEDDVMVLVPGYLAGAFGAKESCVTAPDDVDGLQMRAAGKAFEQMLAEAGASITSMPSSELYSAMQTGIIDAANTSSSSFVSFRLYEQIGCFTPAADVALWFMYQPLLMNKRTFDDLPEEQQQALVSAGEKAAAFYLEEAKKADAAAADRFREAGVEIAEMSQEDFDAWREVATRSAYKDFADNTPGGQELLDAALAVQ